MTVDFLGAERDCVTAEDILDEFCDLRFDRWWTVAGLARDSMGVCCHRAAYFSRDLR